MTENDTRIAE